MISGDVREAIARYCAIRDAIDENICNVITGVWGDGVTLVGTISYRCRTYWRDAPICTGRSNDVVTRWRNYYIDREASGDGVVSGDVREAIGAGGGSCYSINDKTGNVVAKIWSDGDGLVIAVVLSASTGR